MLFDFIESLQHAGTAHHIDASVVEATPAAAAAAFDAVALQNSMRRNQSMIAEVVDAFLGEHQKLRSNLDEALTRGDSEALRRAAHAIKGSCRICFAATAAELAETLESKATSAITPDTQGLADNLRSALERTTNELRAWRGNAKVSS